jgi:TRAP-type C4-dicarboxylate transport system substrate-binding protein
MKQLHKVLAVCLSLLVMVSLLTACGNSSSEAGTSTAGDTVDGESYTLIFSMNDPETSWMYSEVFQPWFERIETESNGQVKIECHFNEELVSLSDAYDAVCKGTIDMAFVRNSAISVCELDNLFENTYPSNTCETPAQVITTLYDEFPELGNQYSSDCTWLLHFAMTPGYIGLTGKDPVQSVSDLSGAKLITASTLQTTTVSALGGAAVDVAPPDFYTSLEKGVADGAVTVTMPEMITNSWADVIHSVTTVPMLQAQAGVIINTSTWNSLPENVRTLIEEMKDDIVALADTAVQEQNSSALDALNGSDYDVTVVQPSDELLADLTAVSNQVIEDELARLDAKGLNASAIYARYLELTAQ